MKIITVVGARPQLIKEAIIQNELRNHPDIHHVFIHSGQHFDANMSSIFLEDLTIKRPDYNLGVNSLSHAKLTAEIMIKLDDIFIKEDPDLVILYGDTNTTLAAALTAKKLNIKIAHIEAGLRQEPKTMPEEINRVLTDHLSDYLFLTSKQPMLNLRNENIHGQSFIVGDVMYDLYKLYEEKIEKKTISSLNLSINNYVLVTFHRDFNVDNFNNLKNILNSLKDVNDLDSVVLVIHPRTEKKIKEFGLSNYLDNWTTIPPQGYLEMMSLVKHSKYVITDSGGLQKESYFNDKTAFIIMPDTCWSELIDEKINILCNTKNIINKITKHSFSDKFKHNIYGDGDAAKKIIDIIKTNQDFFTGETNV